MPWTAASIRRAYRLTSTPELVEEALSAAQYQELQRYGPRANGGTVEYTWHLRLIRDFFHQVLGLPSQGASLVSVTQEGGGLDGVYLSDNGWSLRRPDVLPFIGNGSIVARVVLVNDEGARDALVASLVMEHLGLPKEIMGRGWLRLVKDLRGPSLPARLPDETSIAVPGIVASTDDIYVGLADDADDDIRLDALTREDATTFQLPAWTGSRHIIIVRPAANPIRGILIGGIDQIAAFTQMSFLQGDRTYIEWISRDAWNGAVASEASVRLI